MLLPKKEGLAESLRGRPAWGVVQVGNCRVAITHGDEKLVSGWECSTDALKRPERRDELERFFDEHSVNVLSTTHTCAAAAARLENGVVINNGSAGLPEYSGMLFGLVSRISKSKHPDALYRTKAGDVYVEAIPVRYDNEAFISWFDSIWEEGSPAAQSYRPRAIAGPDTSIADAVDDGFEILV